jgi:hypothetical protein
MVNHGWEVVNDGHRDSCEPELSVTMDAVLVRETMRRNAVEGITDTAQILIKGVLWI